MELIGQFWWAVALVIIVAVVIRIWVVQVRKRRVAQYKQDESLVQHFVEDLDYEELETYRNLPSREARLEWLTRHSPEFMAAVERHFPAERTEVVIARLVDVRLLKRARDYDSIGTAVSLILRTAVGLSLTDYQEIVDERNEQHRIQEETRRKEEIRRAELERQRREAAAAEAKARKEAGKQYWDSLTATQKEAFKKAKGKTARQNTLPSPSANTPYPVDVIYAAIMANEFSNMNSNHSNSIDYCESSPSHSYSDTGSHHGSHDSGGSYSDSSSSSSSGGGE